MKNIRLLLILILSVVSMTAVRSFAQNNSLKIDDSCYPSFRQADSLVGTDRFPALIQEFENKALSVEDKKPRCWCMSLNSGMPRRLDQMRRWISTMKN